MLDAPPPPPPIHERQRLLHCALHATNNLLQRSHGPLFTAQEFQCFAAALHAEERALGVRTWLNPHCALLPVGDWGVEVIARALGTRALAMQHFALPQHAPRARAALGFLLNRPSMGPWAALLPGRRHWVALVPLAGGVWHSLDSALAAPARLGGLEDVLALLAREAAGTQVFNVIDASPEQGVKAAGVP